MCSMARRGRPSNLRLHLGSPDPAPLLFSDGRVGRLVEGVKQSIAVQFIEQAASACPCAAKGGVQHVV